MAGKYIICETMNGRVEEMRDKTDWFREEMGDTGVQGYYDTIIDAAVRKFGGIEKIKRLACWEGNLMGQTLVYMGKNLLRIRSTVGPMDPEKFCKAIAEFTTGLVGASPREQWCWEFTEKIFKELNV